MKCKHWLKKIVESLGTKKFSNNTYSQNWWNEEKCWLTVQILKEEEEEKKKYMRDKGNSWWAYINQDSKNINVLLLDEMRSDIYYSKGAS